MAGVGWGFIWGRNSWICFWVSLGVSFWCHQGQDSCNAWEMWLPGGQYLRMLWRENWSPWTAGTLVVLHTDTQNCYETCIPSCCCCCIEEHRPASSLKSNSLGRLLILQVIKTPKAAVKRVQADLWDCQWCFLCLSVVLLDQVGGFSLGDMQEGQLQAASPQEEVWFWCRCGLYHPCHALLGTWFIFVVPKWYPNFELGVEQLTRHRTRRLGPVNLQVQWWRIWKRQTDA